MEPEYTLPVHPIVAGLATRVIGKEDLQVALAHARTAWEYKKKSGKEQIRLVELGITPAPEPKPRGAKRAAATSAKDEPVQTLQGWIDQFGTRARSPDLEVIQGYNGSCVCEKRFEPAEQWWHVIFLDIRLSKWVIVPWEAMQLYERREDPSLPFGYADRIWVAADARIGVGDVTTSVDALWLSGDFTRAGDFRSSLGTASGSSTSGVLCDAITPRCCKKASA
jgi:hypothetical protein